MTITNRSNIQIYLEDVFAGSSYRPWLSPWRRRGYEGISMKLCDENFNILDKGAQGTLKPGEYMDVFCDKKDIDNHASLPSLATGFSRKIGIWVNHSADDHQFHKIMI